jgi:hypothetical protein
MSRRSRALLVGVTLAAMSLAGTTAAQALSDDPGGKDAMRPPTEGRVGESWHDRPEASPEEAALRRIEARERFSIPRGTPTPATPAESRGQPGWLLASLGVLAVVLGLTVGLAVLAPRRAGRRARARQATWSAARPTPTRSTMSGDHHGNVR